jgi:cytochrome c peroxidase
MFDEFHVTNSNLWPRARRLAALLCIGLVFPGTTFAGSQPASGADNLGLPPPERPATSGADRRLKTLGKQLFFDRRLSKDGKISCATCHIPREVFTDKRPRSVGHDDRMGTRNAPSLLNVGYSDSLFWDGRTKDLETQAIAPLTNPLEQALPSEESIAIIVRRDPGYVRDFSRLFGAGREQITPTMVTRAISAYERSLVAGGSPFDQFEYGHDTGALTPAARRGLQLFQGRAQCASCHLIGPSSALLTDGQFHSSPLGIPKSVNAELGPLTAKVVAIANSGNRRELEQLIAADSAVAALGRFVVTLKPDDIGKFKTPSLRNVALTAPYMHDGSINTLEEAVDLELYSRGTTLNYPIALTLDERLDLVEFLAALTSPRARL